MNVRNHDLVSDEMIIWRRCISTKLRRSKGDTSALNSLVTVKQCRSQILLHNQETRDIEAAVTSFLQTVSDNLPEEFSHLRFTPVLCGSMAEGTKCYQPDELDYICDLGFQGYHTPECRIVGHVNNTFTPRYMRDIGELLTDKGELIVVNLAAAFYSGVDRALNSLRAHKVSKAPYQFMDRLLYFNCLSTASSSASNSGSDGGDRQFTLSSSSSRDTLFAISRMRSSAVFENVKI